MNIMSKKLICLSIALTAPCAVWAEEIVGDVDIISSIDVTEEAHLPSEEVLPVSDLIPEQVEEVVPSFVTDPSSAVFLQELINALESELEAAQGQLQELHLKLVHTNSELMKYKKQAKKIELTRMALYLTTGAFLGIVGTYLYQAW